MPPGTVHLLVGEPMNAQELFAYHFAVGKVGETRCRFVSTDATPEDIQEGIGRVGGDPERVDIRRLPDGNQWDLPAPAKDARYVLDNFSTYADAVGWEAAMESLQRLKTTVRESGEIALVTAMEVMHDPRQLARMKLWADGIMEFGFDRQGFGLYPFLKVTKMRGVPDSARFLLFKDTAKGLFMESTRRVF